MASGNQASDGNGQGPGYQIGELDLGAKPKQRPSSAELPIVQPSGHEPGAAQARPSAPQSQTALPAVGPARPAATAIGYALADAANVAVQRAQVAGVSATQPEALAQAAAQARAAAHAQARAAAQAQAEQQRASQIQQTQGQRASQVALEPVRASAPSQTQLEPVQQAAMALHPSTPANQQGKGQEKGLGRANAFEDEPEAPALELDLDVPVRGAAKKAAPAAAAPATQAKPAAAQAKGAVAQAKPAAAQAKAAPAQAKPAAAKASTPDVNAYGGKEVGDGFGEPEDGPALELEHIDRSRNDGRVSIKGADNKADAIKEEQVVRELAGFGDSPESLGETVRYAIHVAKRLLALKREREKAANDASGLEADYNTALVEMGQALMAMGTDPKMQPLRRSLAAVHDANAKVNSAEQTMSKAKEENQKALDKLERECQEMRNALQPYMNGEADADRSHKKAEDEVKRADGLLKRVEIELRAATDAKTTAPDKLEALRVALEERKTCVGDAQAKEQLAAMALGNARRELALRRGTLDAHEEKKKLLLEESKRKEAEVEQHAKAAEGTHAVALRALAQTAIEQKLEGLVPERHEWVKEVEGAVNEARRVVARYDRALTMYERADVIKGFAVMGGLATLLMVAIALALS